MTGASLLPAIISKASMALDSAKDAAEVLEIRNVASAAYDKVKVELRLEKARGAHDDIQAVGHRLQGDALALMSRAKLRLADEYDAAQARGDVRAHGERGKDIPDENVFLKPTSADIGITSKEIHEARQVRDAEKADPGVVERTIDEALERGEEPTKAMVKRAVSDGRPKRKTEAEEYDLHTTAERQVEILEIELKDLKSESDSLRFEANAARQARERSAQDPSFGVFQLMKIISGHREISDLDSLGVLREEIVVVEAIITEGIELNKDKEAENATYADLIGGQSQQTNLNDYRVKELTLAEAAE